MRNKLVSERPRWLWKEIAIATRHDALTAGSFELVAIADGAGCEGKAGRRLSGCSGLLFMGKKDISPLCSRIWVRSRMPSTRAAVIFGWLFHPTPAGGIGRFGDVSWEESEACRPPAALL